MIRIGSPDWQQDLLRRTTRLDRDFWKSFQPASKGDIAHIERETGRKLDPEFETFYTTFGYGSFPGGGDIYLPEEILECLPNPIFFLCGSLAPSAPWATLEEHVDLWKSRGELNPSPERFTPEVLQISGIWLYDLLQFGTDGTCCYHQLYVGPEPAPIRYCLLAPGGTAEDMAGSFSAALDGIIRRFEERE